MKQAKEDKCVQHRFNDHFKTSPAVASMFTKWTTYMLTGKKESTLPGGKKVPFPELTSVEEAELKDPARKVLAATWNDHPAGTYAHEHGKWTKAGPHWPACPDIRVFWSDYGAGSKNIAQKMATDTHKASTVEMCGIGHYMEKTAKIGYNDLKKIICGSKHTEKECGAAGSEGAKYFWDRVSIQFALEHNPAKVVHVFKPVRLIKLTMVPWMFPASCFRSRTNW